MERLHEAQLYLDEKARAKVDERYIEVPKKPWRVTLDGTELAGRALTTPEDILKEETDAMDDSHGSHCAATAAGATSGCAGG